MYQQPPNQPQGWQPLQPQSMQPVPKKKRNPLWLILGIVALLALFGCIGTVALASSLNKSPNSGTAINNSSSPVSKPSPSATTPVATSKHFKQTEAVQVGDTWNVEIVSVKASKGGQFNTLQKASDVYLDFLIKVKNVSNQEQNISSLAQFTLLDSTGQKYNETINPNAGATLDGKVEPGQLLQGSVSYEVPASQHNFTLGFEASILSQGQVIWDIRV